MLSLNQEKKIWKRGFKVVGGLDESGRGPIAGPVTAAVLVIDESDWKIPSELQDVGDSKELSRRKREKIYKSLNKCAGVKWATSRVGSTVIDQSNILEATKLAMERAVSNLKENINFLMIDGNFKINSSIDQESYIGGDKQIFSIAAASIIAKVSRDRAMRRYDKIYPGYGFSENKGYP
ncbi:MAG: ribonuclease HII, partial [Candidatus Paceibacterota bacterium]